MSNSVPFLIYADGASSGNPGPGGWGAIVATPSGQITELGGFDPETTNNRMELTGVIRALEFVLRLGVIDPKGAKQKIEIATDSVYVIRGITQWVWAWRKRGWKTGEGKEVANPDLWKRLSSLVTGLSTEWKFVRGHSGVPGNERVDEIAVAYSQGKRPSLYSGSLLKYDVPIYDLPEDTSLPPMKPIEAKPKAHSYLSLLGGTPMRHASWAECERRVKGQSGAKFKKAMAPDDEEVILTDWGIPPEKWPKE